MGRLLSGPQAARLTFGAFAPLALALEYGGEPGLASALLHRITKGEANETVEAGRDRSGNRSGRCGYRSGGRPEGPGGGGNAGARCRSSRAEYLSGVFSCNLQFQYPIL